MQQCAPGAGAAPASQSVKKLAAQPAKKRYANVARAILDMDVHWSTTFGDLELHDINYSDLLINMWLRHDQALSKTSLYDFMPGISRRTAVKYVQNLIDDGLLIETVAEADRRLKFISLSPELESRVELFLKYSLRLFRKLG